MYIAVDSDLVFLGCDVRTLCPTSRLDVMSHAVDCVSPADE